MSDEEIRLECLKLACNFPCGGQDHLIDARNYYQFVTNEDFFAMQYWWKNINKENLRSRLVVEASNNSGETRSLQSN